MSQHPGDRGVRRTKSTAGSRRIGPAWPVRRVAALHSDKPETPAIVRYGVSITALVVITAALWPLRETIGLSNIALTYLIIVIGTTTFAGRRAGIMASVLGFVLLDFFQVPPYLTLEVRHLSDLFALSVFLGVSVLLSWLIAQAREQARQAQQRAEDVSRLYELSQAVMGAQHPDEVLPKIADKVAEVFSAKACWILLPDANQQLAVRAQAPQDVRQPARAELGMAQWSFEHGSDVGHGDQHPTRHLQKAKEVSQVAAFVPLRVANRTIGVLGLADKEGHPFTSAERTILATFAHQAAVTLERLRLLREADRAEMLERTDVLKSALMSAVSHDLRTPLASIMASVTSLLDPNIKWDQDTKQDFLQAIYEQARRLNVLVGNLLDMSRIEGGALRPEKDWYSIAEVVEAVVQRLEPALAEHRVTINTEANLPLTLLDFSEIDQVITNLLENAIKHTPPATSIAIDVRHTDANIVVKVADEGPGVPTEYLSQLFDKFYKVNSGLRTSGTGLGLAISKGLIEAHGGRIWAKNRPGGGLEVTFTLPVLVSHGETHEIKNESGEYALPGGK